MTLCEFCTLQQADGRCAEGHTIPKKMKCVGFAPGIERFCSTPADYVGPEQLRQMALFFGLAGKELKLVLALVKAHRESHLAEEALPATESRSEERLS